MKRRWLISVGDVCVPIMTYYPIPGRSQISTNDGPKNSMLQMLLPALSVSGIGIFSVMLYDPMILKSKYTMISRKIEQNCTRQ